MNPVQAFNWIRQALVDYANTLPPSAREPVANHADEALRALLPLVKDTAQPKEPAS